MASGDCDNLCIFDLPIRNLISHNKKKNYTTVAIGDPNIGLREPKTKSPFTCYK
jgi:hypothetical protein